MKFKKSLLPILAAGATVLTTTPTFSQSIPNDSVGFRCRTGQDTLTTVVYNSKNQEKPLIHWKKEYIDSQNIHKDCTDAANKLQSRSNNDKLTFLGIENNSKNQIVVCLINERGESCNVNSSDELFRLKTTVEDKALSTIVDPNLGKVDTSEIRTLARIYPRIPSRKSWFGLF